MLSSADQLYHHSGDDADDNDDFGVVVTEITDAGRSVSGPQQSRYFRMLRSIGDNSSPSVYSNMDELMLR